jgi:hypothetical protein
MHTERTLCVFMSVYEYLNGLPHAELVALFAFVCMLVVSYRRHEGKNTLLSVVLDGIPDTCLDRSVMLHNIHKISAKVDRFVNPWVECEK